MVLLGPPGSGKGTQGKMLAAHIGLEHLSTGDLFRIILDDKDHPLFPKVQVVLEGKLVSDEVVNQVVEDGLQSEKYADGVVFDGYPRTSAQAEALDVMLAKMGRTVDMVIDFDVSMDVLLHRLLGRRMCPGCKKIYHEEQGVIICEECGDELITRGDDNEETITKRFEEYQEKTEPLKDYYKKNGTKFYAMIVNDKGLTPDMIQDQLAKVTDHML